MSNINSRLNLKYDGLTPFGVGDRHYLQDIIRDYNFMLHKSGEALRFACGYNAKLFGGIVTKGTGDTLNITQTGGVCLADIEVMDECWTFPGTKQTVQVWKIINALTQVNLYLPVATLNGVAVNYVKIRYLENENKSRTKAIKTGSWYYEVTEAFEYVVNTTAPTDYDICIATLVGTAGGSFTITDVPAVNLNNCVSLSLNQTISGIKTFNSIPILPSSTPTTDNQATRKAYVDNLVNNRSRVRARPSTTQSITTTSRTLINFGTELLDTLSEFSSSRFTATQSGYYQIHGVIRAVLTTTELRGVEVWKNGTGSGDCLYGQFFTGTTATTQSFSFDGFMQMNAGDYIEIFMYHNTAVTSAIQTTSELCINQL